MGNNESYLSQLIDVFGKAPKDKIFNFKYVNENRGMGSPDFAKPNAPNPIVVTVTRAEEVLAFHSFPKTIVSIRVFQSEQARSDSRTTSKLERIDMCVIDREWAMTSLDRDIQAKRAGLTWLKAVIDQIKKDGKLDGVNLHGFPGAHVRKSLPNAQDLTGFVNQTFIVAGEKVKGAKNVTPFVVLEEFVADMRRDGKLIRKGEVAVRFWTSGMPDYERPELLSTNFNQLVLRVNAALAEEFFPPKGTSISVLINPNSTTAIYEWRTKDGWKVTIDKGHVIRLLKEPGSL